MKASVRAHEAAALLQLLDEQAALFKTWLESDATKRKALLDRDREQLEASVRHQSELLIRLNQLEAKRRHIIKTGFPQLSEPTLQELVESIPEKQRGALVQREARLKNLLTQVQESNAQSDTLLRQAVAHNQVVLDALLGSEDVPATYGPSGLALGGRGDRPAGTAKARRINQQA